MRSFSHHQKPLFLYQKSFKKALGFFKTTKHLCRLRAPLIPPFPLLPNRLQDSLKNYIYPSKGFLVSILFAIAAAQLSPSALCPKIMKREGHKTQKCSDLSQRISLKKIFFNPPLPFLFLDFYCF